MDFSTAIKTCLSKFIDFTGRAQRSEYWYFFLFSFLLQLVVDIVAGGDFASGVITLGLLIPSLAAGARRLHDTGRSGWWQLLWILPIIGWIILLVFMVKRGDEGENDYGYDPLDRSADPHESARRDMDTEPARREPGKSKYRTGETNARDVDTDEASDENNPWMKVRKEKADAAKAEEQAKKQITEEKKRRLEPPKFGRGAAKKD